MAYQTLTVEIDDYVALIRLARPEALNALNSQLVGELAEALAEADRNDKALSLRSASASASASSPTSCEFNAFNASGRASRISAT